jgi:hypothetical protein
MRLQKFEGEMVGEFDGSFKFERDRDGDFEWRNREQFTVFSESIRKTSTAIFSEIGHNAIQPYPAKCVRRKP